MTVKFAFYKPQKGDWFGNMIAGYTRIFNWSARNYCHVEIGMLIDGVWKWYSSASRNADGKSGTRWLTEEELFKHPERWDVLEVPAIRPLQDMIDTCNKELGKPYDWLGIFGFVTITGLENQRNKWYCSEICQYVYTGKWIKRVSPERLYELVNKKEA